MKSKIHTALQWFLAIIAAALFCVPVAYSAFDPVNDDTDIFLANPNITSERPNVLIVLDNTANWNQPFVNEKNALVQVVNGLSDQFNVGLMMMPETGGGNDSVDGGYVRYHVRQMTPTNKTALASLVNNLDIGNDKGNNATHGAALYEAYRYYAGLTSIASFGKVKTDKAGTTDPYLSPLAGLRALSAPANASTPYNSPIADGCQKNFIILISNGPADNNVTETNTMQARIQALTGSNAIIPLTPSGRQGNWSDEMARYMANNDVYTSGAASTGVQNVSTYVVEVNPGTTGQGPDWTAVMKSTAFQGKGNYFGVTDNASGSAIIDALNTIFAEIQAVNSVFAASSLPVSVSVRGAFLNQLYVGVFRPDEKKNPRWFGNMKLYAFARDSQTGITSLVDANGNPAVNPSTNFISPGAKSFWTQDSTYWGFRDPAVNGQGGASDSPDGELVEKGGVAQQLRLAYAAAEASNPERNLYTCTTGTYTNQCTPGSLLSNTPFKEVNSDITTAALQLDSRAVDPLTAYATKSVGTITDRRSVALSNSNPATSVAVTAISNSGTTVTLNTRTAPQTGSDLTTATPKLVTSASGLVAGTTSVAITSIAKSGSSWRVQVAAGLSGVTSGSTVITINCTAGNATYANLNALTAAQRTVNGFTSNQDFTIPGPASGNPSCSAGTVTGPAQVASSTISVNLASHGFVSGQSVTIAGATSSPNSINGTFNITVPTVSGSPDANNFTFNLASGQTAGLATGTITAAGNTTTATAQATAHGLGSAGSTVALTIYGANPSAYNGSVSAFIIDANSFRYTLGSPQGPNTASGVMAVRNGNALVTVTAPGHTFIDGNSVSIAGATIPEYNGTFTISGVVPLVSFQYQPTASVLPATGGTITASAAGGTISTVTATLPGHGFSVGNSIQIDSVGGADTNHPGPWSVTNVVNANVFQYSTTAALPAPAGAFTARSLTNPLAFVTLAGHGYSTSNEILIAGATPAGYNGAKTITAVDTDNFTYPIAPGLGPNSGTSVTASIKTQTATATSVAHGFATGNSITIAGATPTTFNGTYSITKVDDNTFTYGISQPEGNATGVISAAGVTSTARSSLIRWVRGEDNLVDENTDTSKLDIRSSIHGDTLHSSPIVVNYARYIDAGTGKTSTNDVYVFYGSNDSVIRAVKGGYATDPAPAVQIAPGREAWGFIPPEFFGSLDRLRTNFPKISSTRKKPYFADGPMSVYTNDANADGKYVAADGDKVYLYVAMRRGGRFIYALDVSDPLVPKYLWKIDTSTSGFAELGQTWSQARVIEGSAANPGLAGLPFPVLVFGGGYDPTVEDIDPATITASSSASITTAAGAVSRTMGRSIYVVNALTGALVWRALGAADATCAGCPTTVVSGMDYSISSDVAVIRNQSGGPVNRAYVGDNGGNMWRIDFSKDASNVLSGTVTKIAAIGAHTASGRRKFQYPPSVTTINNVDTILIGTGDREHPFDTTVTNRFYAFRDLGNDTAPLTGTTVANPTILESALFDASANCIQDCGTQALRDAATAALGASSGWYITLASGEKVIGNPVTAAGEVTFGTNQPSAAAGGGVCGSNLGFARLYQISATDATATRDLNASGGLTVADRSRILEGGGFIPRGDFRAIDLAQGPPPCTGPNCPPPGPPPPVVECVITGFTCTSPGGATLNARLRKYWFKEID
jgi:Tfp pilus tip-associated adhesin PilY1